MSDLTVKTASTMGGFNFERSDGERFFSVYFEDASANLYAGRDRESPPQTCIVNLAANVSAEAKLAIFEKWMLAYPERPSEYR